MITTRKLMTAGKSWLLAKLVIFGVHTVLAVAIGLLMESHGLFMSSVIYFFGRSATENIVFVLLVGVFSALVYDRLHEAVLGRRISLVKSMQLIIIPAAVLYLAGIQDFFFGLALDFIIFYLLYKVA